jgi:signal transduction histidine kinase
VSNLLANALHHTPPNGAVSLELRRIEDGSAQLDVRDTGPGIAPEHLPRLFDRFYRADGSRVRGTGGIGLGLSIVRSIMHLHGGTAQVVSQVGRGTTFTLHWPIQG